MNAIEMEIKIEDGVCECGDSVGADKNELGAHFETKHHKDYVNLKGSIVTGLHTKVQIGVASWLQIERKIKNLY